MLQKIGRFSTKCPPVDKMLHGGFPSGQVSLIYGEAGTGKTTFLLQCVITCVEKGQKAFFIDADGAFSTNRLRQMAGSNLEEITPSIGIFSPRDFYEQTVLVENLDRFITPKVGLLVVDTINRLYRLSLSDLKYSVTLSKELSRQLGYLTQIAKIFNLPVLLTSQVRGIVNNNLLSEKTEPVATRTLNFWSSNILHLKASHKEGVKIVSLEKHLGRKISNIFCKFKIFEYGISEVDFY
ncbi:MAG: ATPase domain-containing protein [Candidatus Bathyarchaeota archaeon]